MKCNLHILLLTSISIWLTRCIMLLPSSVSKTLLNTFHSLYSMSILSTSMTVSSRSNTWSISSSGRTEAKICVIEGCIVNLICNKIFASEYQVNYVQSRTHLCAPRTALPRKCAVYFVLRIPRYATQFMRFS